MICVFWGVCLGLASHDANGLDRHVDASVKRAISGADGLRESSCAGVANNNARLRLDSLGESVPKQGVRRDWNGRVKQRHRSISRESWRVDQQNELCASLAVENIKLRDESAPVFEDKRGLKYRAFYLVAVVCGCWFDSGHMMMR